MRITRKLPLLTTCAVAGFALWATAASAQLQLLPEPGNEPCPEVTIDVHHVEGGCHVEIASVEHKQLLIFVPAPVVVSKCDMHVEARFGPDGQGWITDVTLTSEDPPTTPSCTRTACDETDGTQLAWPIAVSENGPGDETGETTFCLRTLTSPPGSTGTACEVHLVLTEVAGHEYQVGDGETVFCEAPPSPPLGVDDLSFAYEDGSERLEVIH